jgi:hypothetical protein
MAARTAYAYQPLNQELMEIRLLILHPPPHLEDPVRTTIEHVFLDEKPVYETISYVWGDRYKHGSIYESEYHFLDVPESAEIAPRRLRHPAHLKVL